MHILRRVWVVVVYAYLLPLLRGVGGALSVLQPLRFFAANAAARAAFFKCFQLNGALFLGSMGAMYFGVAPALRALVGLSLQVLGLVGGGNGTAAEVAAAGGAAAGHAVEVATAGGSSGAEFVTGHSGLAEARPQQQALEASAEFVSSLIFHVLWLYPVYCISFILNAAWYQEVADEAQRHFALKAGVSGGGGATGATGGLGFFKVVRDEIFRLLLMLGFVVQASVLGMLSAPVGPLLAFACYSWLFSFYCFEYGWSARGWRLLRRTRHFERDWLFYLGFGAPGAAATTLFPTVLMNGGVFALVFPLFIAVGAHCDAARSRRRDQAGSGGGGNDDGGVPFLDEFRVQVPVFWFPVLLANFLVKMIQLCCCAKWGGGGGAVARASDDGGRQGETGGAGKKLGARSKSSRSGSSRSSAPATPSAAGDASSTSAA